MVEFLIANGHPPDSVQEYSWDKLKLFYETATFRVESTKLETHERLLSIVATGVRSTYAKGAKAVDSELERIRQERDNLIASKDPMALIKQMAAKLQRGGVKARNG